MRRLFSGVINTKNQKAKFTRNCNMIGKGQYCNLTTECNILEYFAEVSTACNIVPTVEGKVGVRVIKEWKKQKLG